MFLLDHLILNNTLGLCSRAQPYQPISNVSTHFVFTACYSVSSPVLRETVYPSCPTYGAWEVIWTAVLLTLLLLSLVFVVVVIVLFLSLSWPFTMWSPCLHHLRAGTIGLTLEPTLLTPSLLNAAHIRLLSQGAHQRAWFSQTC